MVFRLLARFSLAGIVGIAINVAPVSAALVVNPTVPITHHLTVQPIVVSDDDGTDTATFFGTVTQQSEIEGFIDTIWGQAGIDVDFLTPNSWNNTFGRSRKQQSETPK